MSAPGLPDLLPPVSAAAVHVRWLTLDAVASAAWEPLASLLDDAERERASRFHFAHDRHAYIAAHALLRAMLSLKAPRPPADWRFSTGAHGKPEVVREPDIPPLSFNLSHTRGLVAVALTLTHDVGIDVEAIEPKRLSLALAERFFAPAEVALLRATPAEALPEKLFAVWTLKEACIKAMGRGLSLPLDAFTLALDPLAIHFSGALDERPDHWLLRRLAPTPTHTLALAVRHPAPATVEIDAAGVNASDLLALAAQASGAGQTGRR